jgi:membrane protease subunit (stomatin/prohibitin family)
MQNELTAERIELAIKEIADVGMYGSQVHQETMETALAALREKQARESGCEYCINCPEKITAKKERYSHATETGIAYDNIKVNFCPNCGTKMEGKPCG